MRVSRLDSFAEISTFSELQILKNNSAKPFFRWRAFGDFEPDSSVVFHFYIQNDLPDPQQVFFHLRANEFWELSLRSATEKIDRKTGILTGFSEREMPRETTQMEVRLAPQSTYAATLATFNRSNQPLKLSHNQILTPEEHFATENYLSAKYLNARALCVFFQGAIWIMMLYMFFLYFQNNRDRTYLFYGMYMFFAMYYMLQKIAGDNIFFFVFPNHPEWRHLLNEPAQWMLYIFYNLFAIEFLRIKKYSWRIYSFMKKLNWVYFIYMIVELLIMMNTFDKILQRQMFIVSRVFSTVIGIGLIVWIALEVKSELTKYLVVGSSLFVIFTLAAMFYTLGLPWLPKVDFYPINFMHIGIMLEILCFSLGLGRRIWLVSKEKDRLQASYIEELKKNEANVKEYTDKLEREVSERTAEIVEANHELEIQKEISLRADYEKQLTEIEMSALRLQMNPHFIFNSLNSIRYFILKEDTEKASDYITAFAKLLRIILQNSKQTTVPLKDELTALKLYIEFERQRFDEKFEFLLEIGQEVNTEIVQIQPMIVQPFVENAIWHGLLHKEGAGNLRLRILVVDDDILKIIIEDDGVGRVAAREIQVSRGAQSHKSFGLQITKDRLKMMSQLRQTQSGYRIEDLVDSAGNPLGTRATLKIKIQK